MNQSNIYLSCTTYEPRKNKIKWYAYSFFLFYFRLGNSKVERGGINQFFFYFLWNKCPLSLLVDKKKGIDQWITRSFIKHLLLLVCCISTRRTAQPFWDFFLDRPSVHFFSFQFCTLSIIWGCLFLNKKS